MRVAVWKHPGRSRRLGLLLAIMIALPATLLAQQLPLKTYTTSDGLARDYINRIVLDSRGFLWFCTPEGLSRFDGYGFLNYGAADGLQGSVRDLLESHDGIYWIATASGLYRFDPGNINRLITQAERGRSLGFELYRPGDSKQARSVNVVKEARSGAIWCGTDEGLYRLDQSQGQWNFSSVEIGLPETPDERTISMILTDRSGSTWIGATSGLYRRLPDGGVQRSTTKDGLPFNDVRALLEDRNGNLWVGTTQGLCRLVFQAGSRQVVVEKTYTTRNGLAHNWVTSILQTADGRLWIGTNGGLNEFTTSAHAGDQAFRSYTSAQGLNTNEIQSLAEDTEGQLWIGTESGGAMKLSRGGLASFTEADGLSDTRIASIFEDRAGELCILSKQSGKLSIHRFDGNRFSAIRPNLSERINYGWGWNQLAFQDHTGEWWLPTAQGLYRFPRLTSVDQLSRARPKNIYTTKDGLPGDALFRLYEDRRGDIWIGVVNPNRDALARWERSSGRIQIYTSANGLPQFIAPTVFREDANGKVWIGFYDGSLARYDKGQFTFFRVEDGMPEGMIRDLHIDHGGRLWIATSRGGVARLDDPAAEHPRFFSYTTAQGLASNQVTCVTEDQQGRVYIGTPQGVDRLDPTSGNVKHYTVADGLANNFVNVAYRDRAGALWFGTLQGLSRLLPQPDVIPRAPAILISGLRIAGEDYSVSPLGQAELVGPELSANQNDLQIAFSSISVGAAASLRYQYKLEGAERDWSAPTAQRSITYARLSSGTYRFLVRAVTVDGTTSAHPAFVSFTILRPIWQRWWFLSLAGLFVVGVAYVIHKYRVNRLLELERVRTRIATDLHDDIGASLSRMAILSEVVKLQSDGHNERSTRMLTDISDSARSLVDSMSDIVWSIDPCRDDLHSVILRVRQFAADVLEAQGINWTLQAGPELDQVKLKPEQRRHLFLIFKEALTNIARHAGSTNVVLRLTIAGRQLRAEISDDGNGFVPASTSEPGTNGRGGHGVENMQGRARQLGGGLEINSTPGAGTCLRLTMPLGEQHGMNMLFSRLRK